jgi:tRNA (cytidine32/uridine32-2'-O)-methyltransferase
MLDNIRIVMVRTFHPGNIGSAARSMKTMGLSQLYLVSPREFPSNEALKMAAGAKDAVAQAIVVDSVYEAVKDCSLVIATTARIRGNDLPELSPDKMAKALNTAAKKAPVALIFGPERMGLFNEDLTFAKYRVTIPANTDYRS